MRRSSYNYHGYGNNRHMSQRAVQAYDLGTVPLSKVTKELVFEYIISNLENDEKADFLSKLPLAFWKYVYKFYGDNGEWHHVGTFYKVVDFYNSELVLEFVENSTIDELKAVNDERKEIIQIRKKLNIK